MTMRLRGVLMLLAGLAVMGLASCGHYTCGAGFGVSACTPSGSGLGGGGTTGNTNATAYAYVVDTVGTMDGYTLDTTANTFGFSTNYTAPAIPASDIGAGVVVVQNKFLYAVFPISGQIYGWSIDSSGDLTSLFTPIQGSLAIGEADYNQQTVITNPAGTLLFISAAGANQILVYQIDSSTGALTPATGSPHSTLDLTLEPQNLGMDGLGRYLYVSEDSGDHAGSFIGAYSVSSTGTLTPIGTFQVPLWQMQGDPTGDYLIGISGKTDSIYGSDDYNIYVYNINQSTGAITAATGSPVVTSPQYAPFNIAVQPIATNGALIYSFSVDDLGEGDNPVLGYQLTPSTGALAELSSSPFSNLGVAAWGGFDSSGAYLFMYSEASITAYQVSSTGALTEIAPIPLNTGGYWAVADAQ